MERRKLGALEVSAIGLGCMSMTPIYGEPSEPEKSLRSSIHCLILLILVSRRSCDPM